MKIYIPLIAGALLVGGLIGCDDRGTKTTETTETTKTTTTDTTPAPSSVDTRNLSQNMKQDARAAADATKRGLDKAGNAIENAAEKTKDALTPADKSTSTTITTTTTTQP